MKLQSSKSSLTDDSVIKLMLRHPDNLLHFSVSCDNIT